MASGSQTLSDSSQRPFDTPTDWKFSISVGKTFCQSRHFFHYFWKQKFLNLFLTKILPTNEQTSYRTMSKKRCFLKDCANSDFSGCFVIISLLCSYLRLGDSLNWKYMQDTLSKIWRHNITTEHWLEAYPASLQRLPISFTRYWNSTATISFKYFCRLIKYPPNFETDTLDLDIILHILTEYPNHKLYAQWPGKTKTTKKPNLKPPCSSIPLFCNCKWRGEND